MSKQRAQARAARAAALARQRAEEQDRRVKAESAQTRREKRSLAWRRVRLWQHSSRFQRRKDGWAALGTLAMVVLLLAYLLTSSLRSVLFVLLVLVIAFPALVMLMFDRRDK